MSKYFSVKWGASSDEQLITDFSVLSQGYITKQVEKGWKLEWTWFAVHIHKVSSYCWTLAYNFFVCVLISQWITVVKVIPSGFTMADFSQTFKYEKLTTYGCQ